MLRSQKEATTMVSDGAPYEVKVSRTVRSGGKPEDDIKGLPIAITAVFPYSAYIPSLAGPHVRALVASAVVEAIWPAHHSMLLYFSGDRGWVFLEVFCDIYETHISFQCLLYVRPVLSCQMLLIPWCLAAHAFPPFSPSTALPVYQHLPKD